MARTTAAAVKLVLAPAKDYDTTLAADLTPFIDTASAIVDDVVTCATAKDITLTAARLELIERWLAAHFYKVSDKPYISRSTADASGNFDGQTGKYGEATLYGQTAMRLDSSGCLDAAVGGTERKVAGGFWLGRAPSAQTDYVDRD